MPRELRTRRLLLRPFGVDDIASRRVLEKLGMQREGLRRSHIVAADGARSDLVHYGLLREEWEATRPTR